MSIETMSGATTPRVARGIQVTADVVLPDAPVLVLCGGEPSPVAFALASERDLLLVDSVARWDSLVSRDFAVLVTTGGRDLAAELIRTRRFNDVPAVLWSVDGGLGDAFDLVSAVQLPTGHAVVGLIAGQRGCAAVSGPYDGPIVDPGSFRDGLSVQHDVTLAGAVAQQARLARELADLQGRHLSLLRALDTRPVASTAAAGPDPRLEAELGILRRRYDALSSSRLGRLTLRYWRYKRGH
ncbi:hypothetical protein BKD30_08125 [Tersicoccus phoenicis]|uniref:Uncharacterized protein n=1 Tax=Tersicoccus phoenicis TaxID=554083 RepID=A0A1R1LAH3_9MICC|nr:hypothetical protein [Tersicoccus phoenicis]OMH24535.1 hypothetical protein BKD30_08125 [Tersicoccus phoenicis]